MEHVAVKIAPSTTHGEGLFVEQDVPAGADIVTVISNAYQTQYGRYTNHSFKSNCAVRVSDTNDVIVYAKRDLPAGTEVLVCYEDFLAAYDFHPSVVERVRFYALDAIPQDVLRKYPDAYPPALL